MSFLDFLQKNSVLAVDVPPACHVTPSYNIKKIIKENKISPRHCSVFEEDLTYFFIGKPSYKLNSSEGVSQRWQLPSCFVFSYDCISDIRRAFPFDSGAFAGKRFPEYISMMDINEFNIVSDPASPGKIISAFFGSFGRYFNSQPKAASEFSAEYMLNAFDEEVEAFLHLCNEKATPSDDRKSTIELQSASGIDFSKSALVAVIAPIQYGDMAQFREFISNSGAKLITYNVYSLNSNQYTYEVYAKFRTLLESMGML